MAKRAQTDLKAKQKRQKIIVIVGGVLLLALVAFQAPKVMKKLNQKPPPLPGNVLPPNGNPPGATTPSSPSLAAPTLGSGSGSASGPGSTPSGAGATAAAAGSGAASGNGPASALAVYEVAPQPQDGQLPDLGRFVSKDPFVQQAHGTDSSSGGTGTSPTPTPVPTTPSTPSLPASSAKLSVNGAASETVLVGKDFPAANPLFHLVAATTTSARVAIAGGSYADGRSTVMLKVGKPVTLQNTADGTQYTLLLEPPA